MLKTLFLMMSILLIGCSSIQIVEKEVKVPIYIDRIDTLLLKDSIAVTDTFWYSDITDSLKGVIGSLKVWYNKKIAELKLKQSDTVKIIIKDTLTVEKEKPITIISGLLPMWAEIILIAVGVLLLWFTTKKGIKL